MFLALTLAVMSAHSGAPRPLLQGAAPAPTPVQSAPLPIQSSTPAPKPQAKTPSNR
jgi:hypothetical protein